MSDVKSPSEFWAQAVDPHGEKAEKLGPLLRPADEIPDFLFRLNATHLLSVNIQTQPSDVTVLTMAVTTHALGPLVILMQDRYASSYQAYGAYLRPFQLGSLDRFVLPCAYGLQIFNFPRLVTQ